MSSFTCATLAPRKLLHSALCVGVLGTTVPAMSAEVSRDILFSTDIEGYWPQVFRSLPAPSGSHTFVTSARIEPLSFRGLVQGSLAASYANQLPFAAASNAAIGLTATLQSGLFNSFAEASVQSTVQPPDLQPQALVPVAAAVYDASSAALQFGMPTVSEVTATSRTNETTFTNAVEVRHSRRYTQSFTVSQKSELTLDSILATVVATHQTSGATVSETVLLTGGLQAVNMDLSRSGVWNLAFSDVKLKGIYGAGFFMTVSEITFKPKLKCIIFVCGEVEYEELRQRISDVDFDGYNSFEFSGLGLASSDARLGSLIVDADISAVPLPSGLALGIAGLTAVLAVVRRRRGT